MPPRAKPRMCEASRLFALHRKRGTVCRHRFLRHNSSHSHVHISPLDKAAVPHLEGMIRLITLALFTLLVSDSAQAPAAGKGEQSLRERQRAVHNNCCSTF